MEQRVDNTTHQMTAVYTQGKLLLAARGTKPHPQDHVVFEPDSPFGVPPSFVLRVRPGPDEGTPSGTTSVTPPPTTSYQVAMLFAVRSPPEEVLVHLGRESVRIPVLVAADAAALERREAVPLVRMASYRKANRRNRIPIPFEEMLAHGGEDVRTPLVWPIRLGPLFEGHLELAAAAPRRAIGYSEGFDLREAFLDALRALPPDGDDDRLTTVHVTDTGALIGGRGGGRRMFVSILAY